MAKFLPSELLSEVRNKQGATVFTRNRGGAVTRAYNAHPAQPSSAFRAAQQAAVRNLWTLWLTVLTEGQRIAWGRVAASTWRIDVLAQRYNLSAANHFLAVNLTLNTLGFPPVLNPPVAVYASDPGALALVANSDAQSIVITASHPLAANEQPLIRATDALSPGRNNLQGFYRVIPFPGCTAGQTVFDISSAWLARYGPLSQDRRVGVTVQFCNVLTGSLSQEQKADVVSYPQEVDPVQVVTTTITAAQMRNLFAVPQLLTPLPATGFGPLVFAVWLKTHNTTTGFAGGSDLQIFSGSPSSGSTAITIPAGTLTLFLNREAMMAGFTGGVLVKQPPAFDGVRMALGVTGVDFTGGDGAVDVTVYYVMVPMP